MGRISVDTTAAKEAFFGFGTEPTNHAPALAVVMLCCFKKPHNTQLPPSFATEVVKRRTLCADAVERDPSFGWKNSFSFGYEKAVFSMGGAETKGNPMKHLISYTYLVFFNALFGCAIEIHG